MGEQLGDAIMEEQPHGPLAQEQEVRLFGISDAEIIELCPSVAKAAKTLESMVSRTTPDEESDPDEPDEHEEESDKPKFSRRAMRESIGIYRRPVTRVMRSGALLIASYDDPEEGERVGKQILEDTSDTLFEDFWEFNIKPAAEPIRQLRAIAHETRAEISPTGDPLIDIPKQYALLKAVTVDYGEPTQQNIYRRPTTTEWPAGRTLIMLSNLAEADIQKQLSAGLNEGAFDTHIAWEMLWYAAESGQPLDTNLTRLRQLSKFLGAFMGADPVDKTDFYERMVRALPEWPASERQIITDARNVFRSNMEAALGRSERRLREEGFVGTGDLAAAFEGSIITLMNEFLKRVPMAGPAKAELMRLRATTRAKRSRIAPQGITTRATSRRARREADTAEPTASPAEDDAPLEPFKLITCNLNNHTTTDDIEALIDGFVEQAGQGSVTVREDVQRMVQFMARTDLPPTFRRGIKPIIASKVRFGEDDKLWDLFEFKPTEAAGLSTRTAVAKDSRIYFIKMDSGTLGIIGIKPRSEQADFIKNIRVKTKRRG